MSTKTTTAAPHTKLQLETVLPDWCALRWRHLASCMFFSTLFILFSYFPVSNSETWRDINSSQLVDATFVNRLLPLSEGIRHCSLGTAGKSAIGTIFTIGGVEALSRWFAILQVASLALWTAFFFRLSKSRFAMVASFCLPVMSFSELDGLTTTIFGQILGALLGLILVCRNDSTKRKSNRFLSINISFLMVFLMFVAWVNLDASFFLGLGCLLCYALARYVELWNQQRWSFEVFQDTELQRRIYLFEIGCFATLINPVGIALWKSLLWWPDNPLVYSVHSFEAANLFSWTGFMIAISWATWFVFARKTNPIPVFGLLVSIAATVLVAVSPELIFWFAVAMATSILSMAARPEPNRSKEVKFGSSDQPVATNPLKFTFTLLSGLVIWIAFCLTPIGNSILGGSDRSEVQLMGGGYPVAARQHLESNGTDGLTVCPKQWCDWFQVTLGITLMTNSATHRVPELVNYDCDAILKGVSEWRKIADKYALQRLIVDKSRHKKLLRSLRRKPGQWQLEYSDDQSAIYWRAQ